MILPYLNVYFFFVNVKDIIITGKFNYCNITIINTIKSRKGGYISKKDLNT